MCHTIYGVTQRSACVIPYTIRAEGNMRLIPNMRLIAKGKIDHTSKTAMPSLVTR